MTDSQRYRKYTYERLAAAAETSSSVAGVVRTLGITATGGSQAHIGRMLKKLEIDTSHFTRRNPDRDPQQAKRSAAEIFVISPPGSRRQKPSVLRRALAEVQVLYRCAKCETGGGDGESLVLHVDHISGDWLDNRLENLRFLCPNCHSQTSTYAGRAKVRMDIQPRSSDSDPKNKPSHPRAGTPAMHEPGRRSKYTRELLEAAVAGSTSVAGVLRVFGLQPSGGSHRIISRLLKQMDIDTSHFTGKCHNRGKEGPRRSAAEILVVSAQGTGRQKPPILRRALAEVQVPYQCRECGTSDWNGESLILHVDHINGDWLDNRLDNLRFLCPNCHSQTPDFAGRVKNRKAGAVAQSGRGA